MSKAKNKTTISTVSASTRRAYADLEALSAKRLTIADERRTDRQMNRLQDRRIRAVARAAAVVPQTLQEAAELASVALLVSNQDDGRFDLDWDEIGIALNICEFLVASHGGDVRA
jgi:hypothetical protein